MKRNFKKRVEKLKDKTKKSSPPQVIQSKHEDGVVTLGVKRETSYEFEQGMIEALGVADEGLQNHLLTQAFGIFRPISESDFSRETNITLALMHEINPRNGTESLLAIQMLQAHHLAVKMMERAASINQSIEDVDRNVNMSTKLMRVFNQQLDTLQKLRGKGQQKMTVEHVHVYEGGQAVVGDINQGGGVIMTSDHYPMPRVHCGAKTRHGGPCRQPAMPNGRCRLHGGKSKRGKEHGRYLHGRRTKEAIATRRVVSDLVRRARQFLGQIET